MPARLFALVPPPASPTAAEGDFAAVEAELGTKLPSDWKELVRRYGYGTFGDFLHLFSPFFAPCTMASQARTILEANRQLMKIAPRAVPFSLFPDPEGALPWASTDNGDYVYWLTWGEPDEWPTAVYNPRAGERFDLVERGASGLLEAWLGGEPVSRFLGQTPLRCFDPWRERAHRVFTLSGGRGSYARRLASLVDALAPVEMRGAYGDEDGEKRQVHFVSEEGAWRFTYDTVYGHQLRAAAPPSDLDALRDRVRRAVETMGCTLTSEIDPSAR